MAYFINIDGITTIITKITTITKKTKGSISRAFHVLLSNQG
jgi:hypothetical protein